MIYDISDLLFLLLFSNARYFSPIPDYRTPMKANIYWPQFSLTSHYSSLFISKGNVNIHVFNIMAYSIEVH